MKYVSFVLGFVLLPLLGFTQSKIKYGASISPQISSLMIKGIQPSNDLEEEGAMAFGYSLGLSGQYNLNDKLFLRPGLAYQKITYRHKITGLRFGTNIMNGTESTLQNDITNSSIGIPIDFGYNINSKNKSLNYFLGIGGTINLNLNTQFKSTILHDELEDEDVTSNDNKFGQSIYSLNIFVGIETLLNDKTLISFEPNLRYSPHDFGLISDELSANAIEIGLIIRLRIK